MTQRWNHRRRRLARGAAVRRARNWPRRRWRPRTQWRCRRAQRRRSAPRCKPSCARSLASSREIQTPRGASYCATRPRYVYRRRGERDLGGSKRSLPGEPHTPPSGAMGDPGVGTRQHCRTTVDTQASSTEHVFSRSPLDPSLAGANYVEVLGWTLDRMSSFRCPCRAAHSGKVSPSAPRAYAAPPYALSGTARSAIVAFSSSARPCQPVSHPCSSESSRSVQKP